MYGRRFGQSHTYSLAESSVLGMSRRRLPRMLPTTTTQVAASRRPCNPYGAIRGRGSIIRREAMHSDVSSVATVVLNRRHLLALGAAGLAGLALPGRGRGVAAEGLTGEITVQYETRGGVLEGAVN